MPYFPKEETETIRLAKVTYELDADGEIVKERGRPKVRSRIETGETLSFVRKDAPVGVRRSFYSQFTAAQNRDKRIAALTRKMQNADLPRDEFFAIEAEVKELADLPSTFDLMCRFIADSLRSWDYYATKADYEAGTPIPLTADAIQANCDPDILGQISDYLNSQVEEESASGKESPAVSPNGSSQKEVLENVQTSTAIMQ